MTLVYWLDLAGVAVFAISGALAAGRKRMDIFGVVVLGLVTAVGGGTLRDLLLDQPVFWIVDPASIVVASLAAVGTIATLGRVGRWPRTLLVADAIGMSLFAVLGAQAALKSGAHGVIAVVMGMMSGVAGGIIRDLLSGEVPLILRREIYATAALLGAGVLVLLRLAGVTGWVPVVVGFLAALVLRAAAVIRKLALPVFQLPENS